MMYRRKSGGEAPLAWPKKTSEPRVLVVMPAYNEATSIGSVIRRVCQVLPELDVLVVNDGSGDTTVHSAAETGATVISHPYNMGYGAACQTGFKYAARHRYDYVILMDADGQHEPRSVPPLLAAAMEPDVDVVLGSRWLGLAEYKGPLLRKFGKFFFGFLAGLFTRQKITDPTTGFQALTREVVQFYCSSVYPVDYPDADVIIMLNRAGFRIKEVPVVMYINRTGKSMHAGLIRPIYYGMKMMLSIAMTLLRDDRRLRTGPPPELVDLALQGPRQAVTKR
jgi:glycosyltransferase involved in cell wall biosynthesis